MTTKNRSIACYLPPNIEQKLIDYCHNEGILQSDGATPKMGTGILKILELHFGILPNDIASTIPRESLEDIVKGILLDYLPSTIPTFDDVVLPSQLDHRAASIIETLNNAIGQLSNRLNQVEKELATFDKAFDSLGSAVHDHDRMLNYPFATKDELYNAIAQLKSQISQNNSSQNTPKNDETLNNDDLPLESNNNTLPQLFDDKDVFIDPRNGLTVKQLAQHLGVSGEAIRKWGNGDRNPSGANANFSNEWEKKGKLWFPKA